MARFKATIDVYFDLDERWDADADGALADGISGMMENATQSMWEAQDGFLLADWSYHPDAAGDFTAGYAAPFTGLTPNEQFRLEQEE